MAASDFINTHRLQAKLEELHTAQYGGKLLCDPRDLARSNSSSALPRIQGQLVKTQHELWGSEQWPVLLGAAITLLLAVPWTWYFLLRRLKEFVKQALESNRLFHSLPHLILMRQQFTLHEGASTRHSPGGNLPP